MVPNLEARRLFWDFWILGDATREFPGGYWQKYQAADICTQIMNTFNPNDVESIGKCRKLAEQLLGDKINSDEVFHEYLMNGIKELMFMVLVIVISIPHGNGHLLKRKEKLFDHGLLN